MKDIQRQSADDIDYDIRSLNHKVECTVDVGQPFLALVVVVG